jgi:hypothetical protein
MKSLCVIALACLFACTNTQLSQPQIQPLDDGFYNPPNTTTVVVGEKRDKQAQAVDEEARYQESLKQIEHTMYAEVCSMMICARMNPAGCTDVSIGNCATLHHRTCDIPDMIDSRGGIHHKTYCSAR